MSYENHAWRHRPKAQGGTDPIEPGALPYAYAARTTNFTLESGLEYSLCAGDDDGFGDPASVGNAQGIMSNIYIADNPGATFFLGGYPNFCITLGRRAYGLYAYDAFVEFESTFDGVVAIYPDTDFQMWDANEAVTSPGVYVLNEWRAFSTGDYNSQIRISGVALLSPDTSSDSGNRFSVIVEQLSGSDQDVQQAWALITALGPPDPGFARVYPA